MDQQTKKKIIIGVSIGAAIIAGIFIKNKLEQSHFKPISKDIVIQILKKSRKENFNTLKDVSLLSNRIATQMKISQIDTKMVRSYLQTPQSPIKISQEFQKNYNKICTELNVSFADFNASVQQYIKNGDQQVKNLVHECQSDYEVSLSGRLPQLKITVPSFLTKDRIIEIQKKLTLKRYLLQIDLFRKVRGKTQQQLMSNPDLLNSIGKPEVQQQKILQEEGLGSSDAPALAVFAAAVSQCRNDVEFKQKIQKIETHYSKIFNRYKSKMQQNKLTENELNEFEDELIYSQSF